MRIRDVPVIEAGTVPLEEISGLALARHAGAALVLAVGDRAASVAWSSAESGVAGLSWSTADVPSGSLPAKGCPQLEAVAADGAGGVLLVQEWPNRALFLDAGQRELRASFELALPAGAKLGELGSSWADRSCSHTEGALLLRHGHLLVAKEKDPAALLEFGPPGAAPRGFDSAARLADSEAWTQPTGDRLELLAVWYPDNELARACPDLSDIAEAPDGRMLVLSDQGECLAVLDSVTPAADVFAGRVSATDLWRLRGHSGKPEGLAVLPDGEVLIGCDRKGVKRNLYAAAADTWVS